MKVFIAEKPDIGKAIANYLWKNDYKKQQGYFEKDGDVIVTWAYGHILRLATPQEYDEKYKFWKNYPIIPKKWQIKPSANTKKQLDVILQLLKKADIVINAGDPDREGQLLIDEILDYAGYKGTVQRLLLNAKDDVSLKRAFENIQDNNNFKNLYMAGLGRAHADWLVGMNLTRAYSVSARKYGYNTIFRIGRVKIPTLALVVNREKEIQNFKSTKYYELIGSFTKDNLPFKAQLKPSDKFINAENRIKDKAILQAIKLKLHNAEITVKDIQKKKIIEYPPLPYSLDTLQVEANKVYDFSPKTVLDTVQQLYEKKFVSYPRSDCNYIPEAQFEDAKKIFDILDIPGKDKANLALKSKAWNDKKITAHHAIIPTIVKAEELDNTQQKIYEMIAKRYILQFFLPCIAEKTTFVLSVADEIFTGSGQIIMEAGFKAFEGKETSDINILPELKVGDKIDKGDYLIQEKKTTPPKRFTEGTLLAAMANIYKYVDAKNPNREKLKEVKGIGTPATRDTIIAELQDTVSKGRDIEPCLKKVKRELVPTAFGINLIENIDKSLTYPDTTAEMEYKLSEIAEGKQSLQDFVDNVINMVYDNIKFAENKEFPFYRDNDSITCPICNKGQIVRKYSAKIDKYFHMCNNPDCVSPVTGKKLFFEDNNGKPIIAKCPNCKNLLVKKLGKNGEFWLCQKCNKTYNDKNGKPEI
ncbi:DNA topoisomerase III (plasmid) [Megamonas funiformis]|uniref:DNA topoisomerase n=1 Tax=Megamonas funiformis YIT 11815 TaxID=742816 RepID=A0ABN0EF50_9FIRM|nr:DNA topoisomerase 3 [Megamonas funiformis]EHR31897.1 DNA topoisomerase III [Megamonas funiformis YIT 11815]QIB61285.1 DNA topoisomerase III [Megamonas funiformis]